MHRTGCFPAKTYKKEGHGTGISSCASRNLPNIKEIKEILSAGFIYDPQFDLTINGESLTHAMKTSVEALMQIQKAKKGHELLVQLSNMKPEEIDKLSDLLKSWDINDVISVIDEIDRRILVIEAIGRVYENKNTDELHTLHPMVLGKMRFEK